MLSGKTIGLFDYSIIESFYTFLNCDNYKFFYRQITNPSFWTTKKQRVSAIQPADFFHLQFNFLRLWRRSWLARFCLAKNTRKTKRINIKHYTDSILGNLALATFLLQTRLLNNGLFWNIWLDI